jgi:peptidoglycan/xylan/chitin deacetylase (PgdA/CDA1 family)
LRETRFERGALALREGVEGVSLGLRAPALRKTRRGAGILMYHGVTPEIIDPMVEVAHISADLFRRQIRHLKRHYRIVALAELIERLETGGPIPDDWAVLTFDDGYRNNLTCARQILREEGDLPMSVFLATDLIGSRDSLLTTLVVMALMHGRLDRVRVPRPGGEWEWRRLRDRRDRANAYWEMLPVLKSHAAPEQEAIAAEFFSQLANGELAEIRSRFVSNEWLSWDEVRELHVSGADIGGHTCGHVTLRSEIGAKRIQEEVFGCHRRIEDELGVKPIHFAYPNGRRTDFCDDAVQTVQRAGFRCAIATELGTVREDTDRFAIPRLSGCITSMPRFRYGNASGFRGSGA